MTRTAAGPADRGVALIAAVFGVAGFAAIALMMLSLDRGDLAETTAEAEQARLQAAADAGLAIAIHALGRNAGPERWPIDGAPQKADFDGVGLTIRIVDERGKAPLDNLDRAQARALFAAAGADGRRLDALTEEFTDWQLQDEDVGPGGVTSADYAGLPYAPRHSRMRTVGELMGLKDMDRAIFGRLADATTVFFGQSGPFDPAHATAVALAATEPTGAQSGPGADSLKLDTLSLDEDAAASMIGRAVTITVRASEAGSHAQTAAVVELTGSTDRPYWIRYLVSDGP